MARRDAGVALVVALLLVAIMGITGAALWKRLHATFEEVRHAAREEITLHLTEGGLDKAVTLLRANPGYRGETDTSLGEGIFSVAVKPGAGAGHYLLRAEATLECGAVVRHRTVLLGDVRFGPEGQVAEYHWRRARAHERDGAAWLEMAGAS